MYWTPLVFGILGWLGLLSTALMWPSLLGALVMAAQFAHDVDKNVLLVPFAIYINLWSITFITMWQRKENEHAFLWGSAGTVVSQEPRPSFKGKLVLNETSGREELVVPNVFVAFIRTFVAWAVIAACVLWTVYGQLWAITLRLHPSNQPAPDASFIQKQKWSAISAIITCLIIVVGGLVFEKIAAGLNSWENHRTPHEHENSLIFKRFSFEFINNFFILFYIGYMSQIPDPFYGLKKECGGSCMADLQLQMLIIFTGKMYGMKAGELLAPFMVHALNKMKVFSQLNKFRKVISKSGIAVGQKFIPAAAQKFFEIDAESLEERSAEEQLVVEQQRIRDTGRVSLKSITNDMERESFLAPWDSLFEDFLVVTITYGYLALFAVACPVAPLLALINCVTEIRGDAFKLCVAFQRPVFEVQESIGSWFSVLNVLGVSGVVSVSATVAFVSSHMANDSDTLAGIEQRVNSARHTMSSREGPLPCLRS